MESHGGVEVFRGHVKMTEPARQAPVRGDGLGIRIAREERLDLTQTLHFDAVGERRLNRTVGKGEPNPAETEMIRESQLKLELGATGEPRRFAIDREDRRVVFARMRGDRPPGIAIVVEGLGEWVSALLERSLHRFEFQGDRRGFIHRIEGTGDDLQIPEDKVAIVGKTWALRRQRGIAQGIEPEGAHALLKGVHFHGVEIVLAL